MNNDEPQDSLYDTNELSLSPLSQSNFPSDPVADLTSLDPISNPNSVSNILNLPSPRSPPLLDQPLGSTLEGSALESVPTIPSPDPSIPVAEPSVNQVTLSSDPTDPTPQSMDSTSASLLTLLSPL